MSSVSLTMSILFKIRKILLRIMLNKIDLNAEAWSTAKMVCSHKLEDSLIMFFDLSEIDNYSSISKLLDKTYVHIIAQLILHVAKSQKLVTDLLIVPYILDHCQLPVPIFLTLPKVSVVQYNPSKTHIEISKDIHP